MEQEWFLATSFDGVTFWPHIRKQHRKVRLFSLACSRRAINLLADKEFESILDTAELFADQHIDWQLVQEVRKDLGRIHKRIHSECRAPEDFKQYSTGSLVDATLKKPSQAIRSYRKARFAIAFFGHPSPEQSRLQYSAEGFIQVALARDIFGNPFRPVTFDPAWRTADATGIAARMYESRDFSAMPILADALEEAGCTNADVLLHCREPGVHVRGCWVVDLVLGKS